MRERRYDTGLQIIKPEREKSPELQRSKSGQRRKGGGRKTFVTLFSRFSFFLLGSSESCQRHGDARSRQGRGSKALERSSPGSPFLRLRFRSGHCLKLGAFKRGRLER